MKTYIAFVAFALLLLSSVQAQPPDIDVSLDVSGSTVTVTYHFDGDYSTSPKWFWNSQILTIRWAADGGGANPVTITSFSESTEFDYAQDGVAIADNPGSATFYYQKFVGNITFKTIPISLGTDLAVFSFDFTSSDGTPNFELVTGVDLPGTVVNGDAAINAAAVAPNNRFRNFITNNTFPVEWLYFDAKPLNSSDIQLDWGTAREVNNSHFMVESSIDGTLFEAVGRVDGKGTTETEQKYGYIDQDVNTSVIYYRLKQVDLNGAYEYSEVVEVDFAKFPSIQGVKFDIYPSPTVDFVNVEAKGKLDRDFELRITDLLGRTIYEGELDVITGNAKINVSKFSEGIYYVSLSDVRTNEVYGLGKFVKE